MRFVAIDVETANAKYHSICQIGAVLFDNGREVDSLRLMVNPEEDFGIHQMRIHGITPEDVMSSPNFSTLYPVLRKWTDGSLVVSHSHFDRAAVSQACNRYALEAVPCTWIDSISMAKAAWPNLQNYKLKSLADSLGISFRHHDALEDARVCALIAHQAIAMGVDPYKWAAEKKPPSSTSNFSGATYGFKKIERIGDGDGALLGETIVFTGDLKISREHAADMAAAAGANVKTSVTKLTTMLVVGERDILPGWGHKSTKHQKAEELIERGYDIRIVGEEDFLFLASITDGFNLIR